MEGSSRGSVKDGVLELWEAIPRAGDRRVSVTKPVQAGSRVDDAIRKRLGPGGLGALTDRVRIARPAIAARKDPDRVRCALGSGEFAAIGPLADRLIAAETGADVFGPLRALVVNGGAVVLWA